VCRPTGWVVWDRITVTSVNLELQWWYLCQESTSEFQSKDNEMTTTFRRIYQHTYLDFKDTKFFDWIYGNVIRVLSVCHRACVIICMILITRIVVTSQPASATTSSIACTPQDNQFSTIVIPGIITRASTAKKKCEFLTDRSIWPQHTFPGKVSKLQIKWHHQ
jgi:hypothetical protein